MAKKKTLIKKKKIAKRGNANKKTSIKKKDAGKSKKKESKEHPLIQNYGLFWNTDEVDWGKQNDSGTLMGKHGKEKSVNFRNQIGIYILYKDFKLVYIGQAGKGQGSLFKRLKHHYNVDFRGRFNQFSWFGLRRVNNLKNDPKLSATVLSLHTPIITILNHLEAILLYATEPSANRQGGKWAGQAKEYFQCMKESTVNNKKEPKLNREEKKYDEKELIRKIYLMLKGNS